MSLITMIKDDDSLKDIIHPYIEELATNIKTVSKRKPKEYKSVRNFSMYNGSSRVLGNSFDLLARVYIAANRDMELMEFIAENSIDDLFVLIDIAPYCNESAVSKSVKTIFTKEVNKYLKTKTSSMELIDSCIEMSLVKRRGYNIIKDTITDSTRVCIQQDLASMMREFKKHYKDLVIGDTKYNVKTKDKLFNSKSFVDLYSNNSIIDFKTTEHAEINLRDLAQVVGYWISNRVRPFLGPVDRLILYKASFGEIEYINVEQNIKLLNKIYKEVKTYVG